MGEVGVLCDRLIRIANVPRPPSIETNMTILLHELLEYLDRSPNFHRLHGKSCARKDYWNELFRYQAEN